MNKADFPLKSVAPAWSRCGWLVTLVVAGSVALSGCENHDLPISEHPSNKAKGVVCGAVGYWSESRLIKGEMNYGFVTNVTVQNLGETGFIKVTVFLKCSEGEWNRSKEIALCKGEYQTLQFFFEEPTLNAAEIECRATVLP